MPRKTSITTWSILGTIVAAAIASGFEGMFEAMAKTNDWVLENWRLVQAGLLVLFFLIWLPFILIPWRKRRNP